MKRRPILLVTALAVLAIVVALPTLAAEPSTSPAGRATRKGEEGEVAKDPITLDGTVASSTDAEGKTTYTLQSGGTTYTLEAGPSWFYGDDHPLKPFVGTSVKIVGEKKAFNRGRRRDRQRHGTARGQAALGRRLEAGREDHPGWSQEKADRFQAKFGDCLPPGHYKKKTNRGGADTSEGTNPD